MANNNTKAIVKKETVDIVAERVRSFQETGQLHLPPDYSAENAMKSAWLIIQEAQDKDKKPALSVCSRESIANALLDMIVQALNPAKKQCYFIVYGNKLVCQRSYFGSMSVAKMVDPTIEDIFAEVVYEGDKFKYEISRGQKKVTLHEQDIDNVGKDIKAAYCIIIGDDEIKRTEIMTFNEIKQAWKQSKMYPIDKNSGNVKVDSTHGKFMADMAKKTVINKGCKPIINSSNDSSLVVEAARRSEEIQADHEVAEEIDQNANQEVIDIESETESAAAEPEVVEEDEIPAEEKAEIEAEEAAAAPEF